MNDRPNGSQPKTSSQTGTTVPASSPAQDQHVVHLWTLWLIGFVFVLMVTLAWVFYRLGTNRAWKRYAEQIGGEFRPRNVFSPDVLTGTIRSRGYMLETGTSNEDDAPYYHTKASIPIKNGAGFVMGLRRKSMLEEAQTRKEKADYGLEDAEFTRQFFVVSNNSDAVGAILTPEVRRELVKYHDIEIYIRLGTMEWRRSGEVNDLKVIERLTNLLLDIGEKVDSLPSRPRTLSERLADEALIQRGV